MKSYLQQFYTQFMNDRCPQVAAALAYTSLLALVPSTVIVYKIFSSGIVLPEWGQQLQHFVFTSLSPTMAEQVSTFILSSAIHAESLNIAGILMLALSVILMMYTIDTTINRIWHIHRPRYLFRRITVYVLLLVFGPIAMAFSLFLSTYLVSLPLIHQLVGDVTGQHVVLKWVPLVVTFIAFTVLYKWIPDCVVGWRYAVSGGLVAASLFDLAKHGFGLYVSYFTNFKVLYGALASIPLLLIWIYLTWLIVLIGAEITHSLTIWHQGKNLSEES